MKLCMVTAQAQFFCDTKNKFVIDHCIGKKPIDGSGWKQQISQHYFMNILFVDNKMAQTKNENFEQSYDQY